MHYAEPRILALSFQQLNFCQGKGDQTGLFTRRIIFSLSSKCFYFHRKVIILAINLANKILQFIYLAGCTTFLHLPAPI